MNENLDHYRHQVSLARTEIKNLRQQLSSLKHEHLKEIQHVKSLLKKLSCSNCADQATTLSANVLAEAPPPRSSTSIEYRPIGVIETGFQNKRAVPRQPNILSMVQGAVVIDNAVFNNPEHALLGLAEFSHMWIIFHFHTTEGNSTPAKVAPPRLEGERQGVFATRSPHRPCPIGLSLVKILHIEGNRIHFRGVDMVNGTPVLDIKPYIPQYDHPAPLYGNAAMSTVTRPPTEGISDVVEGLRAVGLDDRTDFDRLSAHPTDSVTSDPDTPRPRSPFQAEAPAQPTLTPSTRSPVSPNVQNRDSERGAPDGQERFTPPQSAQDSIRIAPWIANPQVQVFQVRFTDDSLNRLNELIGDRAPSFKTNIENLLAEDPRSVYVRSRYPNHEYSCVLEDLSITCAFDSDSSICTILAVRSAEELQSS